MLSGSPAFKTKDRHRYDKDAGCQHFDRWLVGRIQASESGFHLCHSDRSIIAPAEANWAEKETCLFLLSEGNRGLQVPIGLPYLYALRSSYVIFNSS